MNATLDQQKNLDQYFTRQQGSEVSRMSLRTLDRWRSVIPGRLQLSKRCVLFDPVLFRQWVDQGCPRRRANKPRQEANRIAPSENQQAIEEHEAVCFV